jgi:hypothetical protein
MTALDFPSERYVEGFRHGRADRLLGFRLWTAYTASGDYGRGYRFGHINPQGGIVEEEQVRQKLNELAMVEMEAEALAKKKDEAKLGALDDMERQVLKAIESRNKDIDAEFVQEEKALVSHESALRVEIQKGVEDLARTVKGLARMAVYTAPKDLVDVKQLKGYAAAHPEVLPFFSKSKPSVSIRRIEVKIEVKEGDPLPF